MLAMTIVPQPFFHGETPNLIFCISRNPYRWVCSQIRNGW